MNASKRRVAVITGAGSGIGAEVSRLLYKKDYNIALIGKSEKNVKKDVKSRKGPIIGSRGTICFLNT